MEDAHREAVEGDLDAVAHGAGLGVRSLEARFVTAGPIGVIAGEIEELIEAGASAALARASPYSGRAFLTMTRSCSTIRLIRGLAGSSENSAVQMCADSSGQRTASVSPEVVTEMTPARRPERSAGIVAEHPAGASSTSTERKRFIK